MTDQVLVPLGPGDRAPDFDLPAADGDGRIALAEYLRLGPVLLTLLRGLYCPFCRRQISQLRPTCETLRAARVELLGVVIASVERARRYFTFGGPPCFPIAAAPDRAIHRAYGLAEIDRTPEFRARAERRAAEILQELGVASAPGEANMTFAKLDFEGTPEDEVEVRRPLQTVGAFLIGSDGVIRWANAGGPVIVAELPKAEELLARL